MSVSDFMKLIFATNNRNKLKEIENLLGNSYELLSLSDLGVVDDIPEDFETLEENASQKAWYIYKMFGQSCFADDTGLEVDALDGAPGVYSARYSRMGYPTYADMEPAKGNIRKLLEKLEGETNRKAQFRTVISLVLNGQENRFEGIVEGEICESPSGTKGFGYDPVFRPFGFRETFAEMDLPVKNRISHRARAVMALVDFLKGM